DAATDAAVAVSPAAAAPVRICRDDEPSMKAPQDVGPKIAYSNYCIQTRAPLTPVVTTTAAAAAVAVNGPYEYLDGCAPKLIHGKLMAVAKVPGGGGCAGNGGGGGDGDWRDSDDEWMLPSASQVEALIRGKRVGDVLGGGATTTAAVETTAAAADRADDVGRGSGGGRDDGGGWCDSDDDMSLPSASQIEALVSRYR
ncbi:hypothetical protein Vretimale_11042, partial [Volvox reticuliferus]